MFNRKKKEIERLRRENAIWHAQDLENIKRTKELRGRILQLTADRDKLEQDLEALQDKFNEEHEQTAGLMKANGELKRALDTSQHTIETQQNEMHTMYEKMSAVNDDRHAEIEKLRGELAETERKLNNAEWREKHFRAGNKTEPAAEAAKNKDGEYFERIDTDGFSAEQIKSVYEEYAHRVLDNGGYFPQDKDGNVWADAFILCLLTENGSQTFAAGSTDEYRSLLGGLFAAARKDKDLSRALTLTKLWDMMFRVKEEPQKEGDGDA